MATENSVPQALMTGALLHFENGVPIADLDVRREHKDRLARVQHVYWQWVKNPISIDPFALFKQLVKGKGADLYSEWRMAQKDKFLFDFVVDHISPPSRRMDEAKVRAAADRMIRIGMETDNVAALDKGSKRLFEVAGLDKPESENVDMMKANFLQPVVTTVISDVDPDKTPVTDEQSLLIMQEFGAYIDPKRQTIDSKVAAMEAKAEAARMQADNTETTEEP